MSLANPRWTYTRGLHDLGDGCYAWLQPDGGWGWSNAGLVVSDGESLLVDTLFDLPLTRDMLEAMRRADAAAAEIDTLVNTHANADHVNGNELVGEARIVASAGTAAEMAEDSPERLAALMRGAGDMGDVGRWLQDSFGAFDFEGITQTLPTATFEGSTRVVVGSKEIELLAVGPAHTRGDTLVHVPGDRTVYTGDILFVEGHPIVWDGPISNWIAACERIEAMDVETVVPGHGPITDKRAAREVRRYLAYVRAEAERRYEAGLDVFEAACDIALDDWESWGDAERIVVNVAAAYRELGDDTTSAQGPVVDRMQLFAWMAKLARR